MASVKKPLHQRAKHFLKEWRTYRSISQERAAERIELSRPNLSKIENGEVPYEQDRLEQLALLYNCTVADLHTRDPTVEPEISIFDLPPDARDQVRDFIRALRIIRVQNDGTPSSDLPDTPVKPQRQVRKRSAG